jgi:dTDP-glucose pyrophosphorylase
MIKVPTVYIPAAGLGSRLRPFTDHLPKPLVGVRRKAAISHIIDLYPEETAFVVAVGYKGEIVREYLVAAYPDRRIDIADIADYDGPGSGLGRTIAESVASLDGPFVFHAADTILTEPWWAGVAPGTDAVLAAGNPPYPGRYRRVRLDAAGSRCVELTEPCDEPPDGFLAYTGVCYVADIGRFTAWARETSGELGESDYLKRSLPTGVNAVVTGGWHDVGSPPALAAARAALEDRVTVTSLKSRDVTFDCGRRIVKVHSVAGLAERKRERAAAMDGWGVPAGVQAGPHCLWYDKVRGTPLSRLPDKARYLPGLLSWLHGEYWAPGAGLAAGQLSDSCDAFYRRSTSGRLGQLPAGLLALRVGTIDGVPVEGSSHEVLSALPWRLLRDGIAVRWHGDLHADNIIVAPDGEFTLIDWRDEFAGLPPPWGDLYYDLGKLLHGFLLPDVIIENHLFSTDFSAGRLGEVVTTSYERGADDMRCLEILEAQVSRWRLDWLKVRMVSGIIFLRMSPLYATHEISEFLWAVGMREVAAAGRDLTNQRVGPL